LFLGNMHLDNGNSAKARAAYERGLRWYPDNDKLKRQLSTLKKDG
jgi:cytochrome c-type biogenesis protein CcmH/NrfG